MKFRVALFGLALVGACTPALAQSTASGDSYGGVIFNLGADVSIGLASNSLQGSYTNGIVPKTTGDGVNKSPYVGQSYSFTGSPIDLILEASVGSSSASNGTASQFMGEAYNVTLTNSGASAETVGWRMNIDQTFQVSGHSTSVAYGGWAFTDPSTSTFLRDFYNNGFNGDGSTSGTGLFGDVFPSGQGFSTYIATIGQFAGVDNFSTSLSANESITVTFYVAASSQAQSQAVPEPSAVGFLATGLGALFLRKKSS